MGVGVRIARATRAIMAAQSSRASAKWQNENMFMKVILFPVDIFCR
jgi:hypothetical protein